MLLKEVKYQCTNPRCKHITVARFPLDYKPFREVWATCNGCNKYEMLRALGRVVTGNFRTTRWSK